MNTFLKSAYSLAIGIAVALFLGYAVSAVYPSVSWQEENQCAEEIRTPTEEPTPVELEASDQCYKEIQQQRAERDEVRTYIMFGILAVTATTYVALNKRTKIDDVIVDGIGFGLIFASFYTISLASFWNGDDQNRILPLIAATATLASTITVSYLSFILPAKKK